MKLRAWTGLSLAAVLAAGAGLGAAMAAPSSTAGLASTPVDQIAKSPSLKAAALRTGAGVYTANCASCHGADRKGLAAAHAPDLSDAQWLYSGDDLESGGLTMLASDIEKTVRFGIRSSHPETRRQAVMPALGASGLKLLDAGEIDDVVDHLLTLAGRSSEAQPEKAKRGEQTYRNKGNCWDCHGDDGIGNGAIGATDFTLNRWLYGGDRASLARSISGGAAGVCPGFEGKLSPIEIKAVSVFVLESAEK